MFANLVEQLRAVLASLFASVDPPCEPPWILTLAGLVLALRKRRSK